MQSKEVIPCEEDQSLFFRKFTGTWYVQIGKQQFNLGKDKAEALDKCEKLFAENEDINPAMPVALLLAKYLQWVKKRRAENTYDWYQMHLQSFAKYIGKRLKIANLKPSHITARIDKAHADSSDSTRHGAIRAVQRAFNWAIREGHLQKKPTLNAEKPTPTKRESVISEEQFEQMMAKATDQAEKDLLITLWDTGCQPQEIRVVEARHFEEENERWVFQTVNSKGRKVQRVVYLSDRALEISKRLAKQYPEGPMFRNRKREPWNKNAIRCRFRKFKNLGIEGLCATAIRYSFTTHALARGVDPVTLSVLLGHSDVTTLSRHYAHLTKQPDHMRRSLLKVRDQDAPE